MILKKRRKLNQLTASLTQHAKVISKKCHGTLNENEKGVTVANGP